MAQISGKNGQVYIGAATSSIAYLDNWSINFTTDKDEITAFGGDWHTFLLTGITGATGTMSGKSDPTASGQSQIRTLYLSGGSVVAVSLWLQETTGQVFTCSVIVDSWGVGVSLNAVETFNASFTVNTRPSHA